MLKTTFFILLLNFSLAYSQTVSTIKDGKFQDGLAIDSQGNIYGSDYSLGTVYKYSPANGGVTIFKSGFSNANGIGVNSKDEIFICDHSAHKIFKYDTNGNELAVYANGLFTTPAGIKAIPNSTDMLVVEYATNRIKKLDKNGNVTLLLSGGLLNGPAGIAYIENQVYIANFNDRKILKFQNNSLTEIAQLPATAFQSNVLGFLSASDSFLYATQMGENKIYKVNPSNGDITLYAGSVAGNNDGDISTAKFNLPNGILLDNTTNTMYISEAGTKNLRVISNAVLSTDILKNESIRFNIVSNPIKNKVLELNFTLERTEKLEIYITNLLGEKVFNSTLKPSQNTFSTSVKIDDLVKGVYILKVSQGDKITSKKIVI